MEEIIHIASDHAGYDLKAKLINYLENRKIYEINDFGTFSDNSVDYPDFIHPLAKDVDNKVYVKGIIICGSGNGVNMVANKYQNVRSALCWNEEIARLARQHNNANILALPARFISENEAISIVDVFFNTGFEGGRHQTRVEKIKIQ
jgi:ribose 5-phosphate isomerase B